MSILTNFKHLPTLCPCFFETFIITKAVLLENQIATLQTGLHFEMTDSMTLQLFNREINSFSLFFFNFHLNSLVFCFITSSSVLFKRCVLQCKKQELTEAIISLFTFTSAGLMLLAFWCFTLTFIKPLTSMKQWKDPIG